MFRSFFCSTAKGIKLLVISLKIPHRYLSCFQLFFTAHLDEIKLSNCIWNILLVGSCYASVTTKFWEAKVARLALVLITISGSETFTPLFWAPALNKFSRSLRVFLKNAQHFQPLYWSALLKKLPKRRDLSWQGRTINRIMFSFFHFSPSLATKFLVGEKWWKTLLCFNDAALRREKARRKNVLSWELSSFVSTLEDFLPFLQTSETKGD